MKKILAQILLFALCFLLSSPVFANPYNPGAELNRIQQLQKQEELMRQLQEEQKAYDAFYDEQKREKKNKDLPYMERVYVLKQISVQDSNILTKSELDKIVKPNLGKEITMKQILAMVDEITALYRAKGDKISKAYLPEEPIVAGTLLIALRERASQGDFLKQKEPTIKDMINN